MTKLFEPITVRGLEVRNRVFMAPMCQYSCENKDGVPSEWHLVHYGARATGGAGLIIMEATAVVPEGRITPWCTGIWNDEQVEGWKKVNDFVHTQGAKTALQLAHAGRKASTYRSWSGSGSIALEDGGWQTVSAGTDAFDTYAAPRELETSEISGVVRSVEPNTSRNGNARIGTNDSPAEGSPETRCIQIIGIRLRKAERGISCRDRSIGFNSYVWERNVGRMDQVNSAKRRCIPRMVNV